MIPLIKDADAFLRPFRHQTRHFKTSLIQHDTFSQKGADLRSAREYLRRIWRKQRKISVNIPKEKRRREKPELNSQMFFDKLRKVLSSAIMFSLVSGSDGNTDPRLESVSFTYKHAPPPQCTASAHFNQPLFEETNTIKEPQAAERGTNCGGRDESSAGKS